MKILIKGGSLLDAKSRNIVRQDILLDSGRVAALGNICPDGGTKVLSAEGLIVAPGLIDMHVHLREPGFEHKETIASGAQAAVHGGFTAVAAMPNTHPVIDSAALVRYVRERARDAAWARVYPVGAITLGQKGQELAPMGELKNAGAVAVSDDGRPVASAALMRSAMQYARQHDLVVISHCEETSLSGGLMNEGYTSTRLGLKGIPASAEEVMVARDIILAGETGCRLHIAHISTAGSLRLVREAKARGIRVTAEATPHHFTLTDDACAGYDTNTKMNPPLRGAGDVEAIREGLADGTIDAIATDHAPHAFWEKEVEFERSPFGIIGLETAVGLVFTELVHTGVLSAAHALSLMSFSPARILGLEGGQLVEGAPADLTLIDPQREEVVDRGFILSRSSNTPFMGRRLSGLPVGVIVRGRVLMWERKLMNKEEIF